MRMGGGTKSMNIELSNESNSTVDELALVSVATFAMTEMGLAPDCDLEITIVEEDEISDLHVQWMGLEGPTDVLSFPIDELTPYSGDSGLLGTIVLCPTFAQAEISRQGLTHPLQHELELLTVHGVLHCLNYDHRDAEEEAAMFGLQNQILVAWRATA